MDDEARATGLTKDGEDAFAGHIHGRAVWVDRIGAHWRIAVEHHADLTRHLETAVSEDELRLVESPELNYLFFETAAGPFSVEVGRTVVSGVAREARFNLRSHTEVLTRCADRLELDLDALILRFLARGAKQDAHFPRHAWPRDTVALAFGRERWWTLVHLLRAARSEGRAGEVIQLLTEIDVGPAKVAGPGEQDDAIYRAFVDLLRDEDALLLRLVHDANVPRATKGMALAAVAPRMRDGERAALLERGLGMVSMHERTRARLLAYVTRTSEGAQLVGRLMCATPPRVAALLRTWRTSLASDPEFSGRISLAEDGGELAVVDDAAGRLSPEDD
ncbi:MAG: hypothetical protein RIT81_29800 [Deltaproteobacteria bacterium]